MLLGRLIGLLLGRAEVAAPQWMGPSPAVTKYKYLTLSMLEEPYGHVSSECRSGMPRAVNFQEVGTGFQIAGCSPGPCQNQLGH